MDHNLEGYLFIHKDTPLIAGGSGLYISANLEYKVRNDLNLNVKHCEDIWAEITINIISRIFAVIYRHPGHSFTNHQDALIETLVKIENKKKCITSPVFKILT